MSDNARAEAQWVGAKSERLCEAKDGAQTNEKKGDSDDLEGLKGSINYVFTSLDPHVFGAQLSLFWTGVEGSQHSFVCVEQVS